MTPFRFEEWSGEMMPCDDSMRVLAGLLCVGEAWPKATVEALGDSVQASELSSSGKPGNGTKVPLMNFGVFQKFNLVHFIEFVNSVSFLLAIPIGANLRPCCTEHRGEYAGRVWVA